MSDGKMPMVGMLATDTRTNAVGKVMGHVGGRLQLRPLGGGREWDVPPEHARPATATEKLSAGVLAANQASEEHAW